MRSHAGQSLYKRPYGGGDRLPPGMAKPHHNSASALLQHSPFRRSLQQQIERYALGSLYDHSSPYVHILSESILRQKGTSGGKTGQYKEAVNLHNDQYKQRARNTKPPSAKHTKRKPTYHWFKNHTWIINGNTRYSNIIRRMNALSH